MCVCVCLFVSERGRGGKGRRKESTVALDARIMRRDGGAATSIIESDPSECSAAAARTIRSREKSGRKTCDCKCVFCDQDFLNQKKHHDVRKRLA